MIAATITSASMLIAIGLMVARSAARAAVAWRARRDERRRSRGRGFRRSAWRGRARSRRSLRSPGGAATSARRLPRARRSRPLGLTSAYWKSPVLAGRRRSRGRSGGPSGRCRRARRSRRGRRPAIVVGALHVLERAAAARACPRRCPRAGALHERVDAAVVVGEEEHAGRVRARLRDAWPTTPSGAHHGHARATPSRSPRSMVKRREEARGVVADDARGHHLAGTSVWKARSRGSRGFSSSISVVLVLLLEAPRAGRGARRFSLATPTRFDVSRHMPPIAPVPCAVTRCSGRHHLEEHGAERVDAARAAAVEDERAPASQREEEAGRRGGPDCCRRTRA